MERRLLQIARREQDQAADDAAFELVPALRFLFGGSAEIGAALSDRFHRQQRDQRRRAHKRADAVEGEGVDLFHADALRHKGAAPDKRGQQQDQAAAELLFSCFFHAGSFPICMYWP